MTILQFPALFHCKQTLSHARNIVLYLPILVDLLTTKHSFLKKKCSLGMSKTRTFTPRKYISRACLSQMHIFILPKVLCCRMWPWPLTLTMGQLYRLININHMSKYHQDPIIRAWVMAKTIILLKYVCDLDLWSCDLDLGST